MRDAPDPLHAFHCFDGVPEGFVLASRRAVPYPTQEQSVAKHLNCLEAIIGLAVLSLEIAVDDPVAGLLGPGLIVVTNFAGDIDVAGASGEEVERLDFFLAGGECLGAVLDRGAAIHGPSTQSSIIMVS